MPQSVIAASAGVQCFQMLGNVVSAFFNRIVIRRGNLCLHRERNAVAGIRLRVLLTVFLLVWPSISTAFASGPQVVHVTGNGSEPLPEVTVYLGGRHAATGPDGVAVFDGLPAGRHELRVPHPGYDLLVRPVDVPAGARQPLDVTLKPSEVAPWIGRVVVDGLDQPVAGAVARLTPVAVNATLTGPVSLVSDWNGFVFASDLAVGRYDLEISLPGYDPLRREIQVQPGRIMADPKVDGLPLDLCRTWGNECGAPAADAWCQANGFLMSAGHEVGHDTPPTKVIGTGEKCEDPSCDRIVSVTCAGRTADSLFRLRRQSKPAKVTVHVQDSQGRPVPKAQVILAEVWPDGVVGNGTTDARGVIVFDKIGVGQINRPDADGRLTVCRRTLTVRAEQDGFVPTSARVLLEKDQVEARLTLSAQAGVRLQKPDPTEPATLTPGVPVTLAIATVGQRYRFRLSLPEPALLRLAVAEGAPIETLLRLLDLQGQLIQELGAHLEQPNGFDTALSAGTYFVELLEWGENGASPDPLTLTASVDAGIDPLEPNDSDDAASLLRSGELMAGRIWARGDRDVYRIEIERPGFLRVHGQGHPMERHVLIRNVEGNLLGEVGAHANNPIDLSVQIQPGRHFVEVREWGENGESLTPYRMQVDVLPDDGVDDPLPAAGQMSAVRELKLSAQTGATLLPVGDLDVYRITLPGAGRLHVQSRGRMERHMQLFGPDGAMLTEHGSHAGNPGKLEWYVAGPGTYFVALREWGDNGWSTDACALSSWFEPADMLDFFTRNDDSARAVPLTSGEIVHGSYMPLGDKDVFVVDVDFSGYLRVAAQSPLETHLRVLDAAGSLIVEQGVHAGQTANLYPPVQAGKYYVMIGEWGDNSASALPYTLSVHLDRAEPGETVPLAEDPPRPLKDGEAQSFSIDHAGDRDRFLFDMPHAGDLTVSVVSPLETLIRIYDHERGALLREVGVHAPTRFKEVLSVPGVATLRLELSEWGENGASLEPGFVMVDTKGRGVEADKVVAKIDPASPRRVTLLRERLAYADPPKECSVELGGDGRGTVPLRGDAPAQGEFPAQGVYKVQAVCTGSAGQKSRQFFWVQAVGQQDRAGILVTMNNLSENQTVETPFTPQAQVVSFDGTAIRRVDFSLDGKPLDADFQTPYEAPLNWSVLTAGKHVLTVSAVDDAGTKAKLERTFTLSEYFELNPPGGTTLTGEHVAVSWQAPMFGPSVVRYRPQGGGDTTWKEVTGESSRRKTVRLPGLETGVTYEFQPLGGSQPGPLRTVTRVKGLAFGRPQYAANIQRDYDQRVGISVRNNGESQLLVRLESGQPADSNMLASFVGAGSEDKPFALAPGEEREFQFALSAQNVNTAEHRIPIRIVSDSGLSDESEILVNVRLPHVEMQWTEIGPSAGNMGRVLRLTNLGDAITDLSVTPADSNAVVLSPTVRHGLFPRGATMDFIVTPRYYGGFKGVKTRIQAFGLKKSFDHPFEIQLAPGESMHKVWLVPGLDPQSPQARDMEMSVQAGGDKARAVDLDRLDWSAAAASDTTGSMGPDRLVLQADDIEWVGTDGDGDGKVDHVFADVGRDGVSEFAALRVEDGWRQTNVVEAWLEMSFALRGSRDSYKTHDVEVLLNGVALGLLKDMLPEGNFSFRIPPGALRFDSSGLPGDNRVGLRTTHLRGGHYAVNSDFRFKFRLTATPVWTAATSLDEAREKAVALSGVSLTAPDLSLSASQLAIAGPETPNAGDQMRVDFPISNFGATAAGNVVVALQRILPGGSREEVGRAVIEAVDVDQPASGSVTWKIRGGMNNLALVADPDRALDDPDLANNEALFMLTAAGDDTPPVLRIAQPTKGAVLQSTVVMLEIHADDDAGPVTPQVSIDRGLWQELPATKGGATVPLLLQPGRHTVEVRVADASGNEASQSVDLTVERDLPTAKLNAPAGNATVVGGIVTVDVAVPSDVGLVAARAAGGPWHKGSLLGDSARIELPLRFGPQTLEVMVADRHGAVRMLGAQVTRTTQPKAGDLLSGPAASDQGLLWPDGHASLEIDLFRSQNGVLRRLALDPENEAMRLWEEARRRQAQGDYAGALTMYRDSLMLKPDPQTGERIRKLEVYLGIKRMGKGAVQ
jgi:hypothetical protein